MKFKKFLKENKIKIGKLGSITKLPTGHVFGKTEGSKELNLISIESLGNWVWQRAREDWDFYATAEYWLEYYKLSEKKQKEVDAITHGDLSDGSISFFSMAVACLGETEIKKRLKEMKK